MVDDNDLPERDGPDDPLAGAEWFARLAGEGGVALRPFTLLVRFLAADERCARCQAQAYVEALTELRPEVDCCTAEVSSGAQGPASPVYCGAPGPDPLDVCVDVAGHSGNHHGPGITGWWSEDEVPTAPDDIEGLD